MTAETISLAQSLHRFAVLRRRKAVALSGVRVACSLLLGAFVLVYVDVLFQLAAGPRLALLCWAMAAVACIALYTYVRYTRARSEARLVARLVEQDDPSLHNELINAIEFEDTLARGVAVPVSRPLMREEVNIASEKTTRIERVGTLAPPVLRGESKFLLVVLAMAVPAALLSRDVLLAVAPRYLDPYGDHPPYSATRLEVDPAGVTVDYGDNVAIRTTARGAQPEDVTLVLEDAQGAVLAELPMLRSPEGDYRQAIDHATVDATYYARIERGRSKRYPLTIRKAPRIGAVNVSYTYPEYTRLPARTRQLGPDGTIKAYDGTRVEVSIASNRPLKGGTMRVGAVESTLETQRDPQSAVGAFVVHEAADIEARIVDVEDMVSADVLRAKVEAMPDTPPTIAIASPGRQSFAIPTAEVPIEIEAQDDLGVANVTLFRELNGSGDLSKTLFASTGGETAAHAVELLDLADLGLRPGDVIDFYATAADTFPSAPHTVATPSHQITIISEEQYRSFLQQETTAQDLKDQYDEVGERLDALIEAQERIEAHTQALQNKAAAGGPLQAEDLKTLADLEKRQRDLAQQTADAGQELRRQAASPPTFDIEKEFKKSLEKMAERLDRAREAMEKSAEGLKDSAEGKEGGPSGPLESAREDQRKALEQLGQNRQQFAEQIGKPLGEIDRMYKLLEDVETFKAIYGAQVDLERQARSYRDVKAPSLDQMVRLKELGQAQKELRDATIDLRENFMKHAAEIEAELPKVARDARDIADGIDGRNIPTVMEQAMNGLMAGDGANGHQNAEEAAHLLDQMIERVTAASGPGGEMEERLKITMGLDAGNTMSQMKNSVRSGFRPGQQSGSSGGGTQSGNAFDVFGPEGNKSKADKESAMSRRKVPASAEEARDQTEFAGAFEELDTDESAGPLIDAPESEPVSEEYRTIVEAYFQRIAEES